MEKQKAADRVEASRTGTRANTSKEKRPKRLSAASKTVSSIVVGMKLCRSPYAFTTGIRCGEWQTWNTAACIEH